jgi:hypothetical protein
MSRPALAALLLLCTPAWGLAQEDPAPATKQDPQAAYNQLATSFGEAMNEWVAERNAAFEKAQETGEAPPRSLMTPPTKQFIATAQELADQFAGTDDAIRFHAFVVKNASTERNAVAKALRTLASEHASSAAIGDMLGHVRNAQNVGARKDAFALLDRVVEAGHADCKAQALLARGAFRLETGDTENGAADLRAVATVTEDEDLIAEAKEALFEVEQLAIGCQAPEIEGVDVEGVAFKLSDYRGKVVLLDFWGFW